MSDLPLASEAPKSIIPPGGLATAMGAGDLASKIPGAVAADEKRSAEEKANAGFLIQDLGKAETRRNSLTPPLPPPIQPPPQPKTGNPIEAWGSLAMGLSMLGSAFTRRPLVASLNSAAEVMKAHQKGDADAYKTAFDRWKAENDYSIKSYEFQRDYYKDALEMIATDANGAKAMFQARAAAIGHPAIAELAKQGDLVKIVSMLNESNARLDKFTAEAPALKAKGEALAGVHTANADLKAAMASNDPTLVADARQKLATAIELSQNLETAETARKEHTPPAAGSEGDVMAKWEREFKAVNGVPPTSDQISARRAEMKKAERAPAEPAFGDDKAYYAQKLREFQAIPGNEGTLPTTDVQNRWTAERQGAKSTSAPNAKNLAAKAFSEETESNTGKKPTYADWVKFSQDTSGAQTGKLSDDAVKMLAQQYQLGDMGVITALPRSGPARIQVENQIAEDMKALPDGAQQIVMNRLRMAEAKAAATTAGRVTMNTELYAQEAKGAGLEVIRTSKLFARTNYPLVNQALRAYETNTGDPNVVAFGVAMNSLINAYGKMSNPTGIGIHDADKTRISNLLDTKLAQGQIESGVEQVIREGMIVSNAARKAQEEVLQHIMPHLPGTPRPPIPDVPPLGTGAAPAATAAPVPATPRVDNQAAYDALPSGTHFVGPDGKERVKP